MPVENPHKNPCFGIILNIRVYPTETCRHGENIICDLGVKLNNGEVIQFNVAETNALPHNMRLIFRGISIDENETIGREVMYSKQPYFILTDVPKFIADYEQGILDYLLTQVERKHA